MARNTSLRITKNDRAEYKRLRNNVTSKVRRINQKFGLDFKDEFTPPPLESFSSRKEFNDWKKKAKSFTNRSNTQYQFEINKYGVVASKKEINKLKRDTELAQRLAKKKQKETFNKLKSKPFFIDGEERGTIQNKMKTMSIEEITGISIPNDFNFDRFQTKGQMIIRDVQMENRSRTSYYNKKNKILKQNFITTIQEGFNSDSDDIIEAIKNIDADDFLELSIMFDEFDIRTYDSDNEGGLNDEDRLETLRTYLNEFNNGKINMKLKNF